MKKRKQIIWLCASIFILVGIILFFIFGSKPKEEISILNQAGETIATVQQYYTVEDSKMVYCDAVIQETAEIVAQQNQCSIKKAKNIMWEKHYVIYTYFEEEVQSALAEACGKYKSEFHCGGAVTDLKGNIVAAYGHSTDNDNINYIRSYVQFHRICVLLKVSN